MGIGLRALSGFCKGKNLKPGKIQNLLYWKVPLSVYPENRSSVKDAFWVWAKKAEENGTKFAKIYLSSAVGAFRVGRRLFVAVRRYPSTSAFLLNNIFLRIKGRVSGCSSLLLAYEKNKALFYWATYKKVPSFLRRAPGRPRHSKPQDGQDDT